MSVEPADCNADAGDGAEAKLAIDPDNCGACGHRCATGLCANGVCQADRQGTAQAGSPIATDGVVAFFITGQGLVSMDDTGERQELVSQPGNGTFGRIALDDTFVFLSVESSGTTSIVRVPKVGGAPATVVSDAGKVKVMKASGGHLYWLGEFAISRVSALGTDQEEVMSASADAVDFDVSGDAVVLGEAKRVLWSAAPGAAATVLADQLASVGAIATDGVTAYWTDLELGRVVGVDLAGGAAQVLATVQVKPSHLAVVDTTLYWTAGSAERADMTYGAILRLAVGAQPEAIVCLQRDLGGLAVHGGRAYWLADGGVYGAAVGK